MKDNSIRNQLEQRKKAMKGTIWTQEKAETIFLGLDGLPTPYEVWHEACLHLARHGKGKAASKARELLQPRQRAARELKNPSLSTSHTKNRDNTGETKSGKIIRIHAR